MLYNRSDHVLYNRSDHVLYKRSDRVLYNRLDRVLYNRSYHVLYNITYHVLYNRSDHMLYNRSDRVSYNRSDHVSYNITYLSNRPHFLWVYRRDNPRGMLGEHEKKLVNHEPKASDLQAFLLGKKYGFSTVIKSLLLSKVIISQS